jgi:putative flavoprotein involved in K+ transport
VDRRSADAHANDQRRDSLRLNTPGWMNQLLGEQAPDAYATGPEVFAARVRALVDELIARRGLDAPSVEPDPTDAPVALDPPEELDLRAEEVASVIWCTGFGGDFSWIDPALLDADGQPRRQDAAAAAPGVWYLGLRWLIRRGSSILFGFPDDAATVADAVKARLDS